MDAEANSVQLEDLCAQSEMVRARSVELRARSDELSQRTAVLLGRTLTALTRIADLEPGAVSPDRAERLRQLSVRLGRDPAIEQAKDLLRERYGITGAEAFRLMRHASQRSNRKLRDVAHRVLVEAG